MEVYNLALVCSDIFPKSERTNRRSFISTVGTFPFWEYEFYLRTA